MNVKLLKVTRISNADIDYFEKESGLVLPSNYKNFVLKFNGAEPETNIFKIDSKNDSGVNRFIPLDDVMSEGKNLDHVSDDVLPIAWAEGGNYVVLNTNSGCIYFWDHELPDAENKLADDIDLFLDSLQKFEPDSVELKEGQVESAWIDPDFLKNL